MRNGLFHFDLCPFTLTYTIPYRRASSHLSNHQIKPALFPQFVLCENDIEEYAAVFRRVTILINDLREPRNRQAPVRLILQCKWPREITDNPRWKDTRDNSSWYITQGPGLTLLKIIKIIIIIGPFLPSQENQDKSEGWFLQRDGFPLQIFGWMDLWVK